MLPSSFNDLFDRRVGLMRSVLANKASEYATSADRLHNFNRASSVRGKTRADVCMGMLLKHFVSILDIVDLNQKVTSETIDEKIGDCINYLVLLEAILREDQLEIKIPDQILRTANKLHGIGMTIIPTSITKNEKRKINKKK